MVFRSLVRLLPSQSICPIPVLLYGVIAIDARDGHLFASAHCKLITFPDCECHFG